MKLMRWAMCVAAFALAGGTAMSEDYVDIQALQAKLAAQEARLNDLQAKMSGGSDEKKVASGITSLRKNATVTIGGAVAARYDHYSGKVESRFKGRDKDGALVVARPDTGDRVKVADTRFAKYDLSDAKLEGKIDVNEYFDAYFKFDLQDGKRDRGAGNAQQYWMRWKNVCNSGFGLLVGRDNVKFGGTAPYGRWDNWDKGISDMSGNPWGNAWFNDFTGAEGMSIQGGMPNRPTIYADSRTTQITPYWENKDGSFKWEVSFFQGVEYNVDARANWERDDINYRRGMNDGVGSFSSRITWKPIEGLTIRGSVMNLHANNWEGSNWDFYKGKEWGGKSPLRYSRNNFATNLGIEYRPCFFKRLNVYGSWTHGWNDGWVKDQDSDTVSFGFGFDVIDNLTLYALADHVRSKSDQGTLENGFLFHKGNGWANEVGFKYKFPYGAFIDAGWRHERMTYKASNGDKHTKLTGDGFFGRVGFAF